MRPLLSVVPMRSEAAESSEQVSQLLFGEKVEVIEEKTDWLKVKAEHDNYKGWVDRKMLSAIDSDLEFPHVVLSLMAHVRCQGRRFPLTMGARLPEFIDHRCIINGQEYVLEEGWVGLPDMDVEGAIELILQFENAPYLWGGRHPLGIDCSGFSQLFYRLLGQDIPRDASQQVLWGDDITLADARAGDLAFFEKNERITHVGILLDNNTIIHASGKVRIDAIDKQGIVIKESNHYSHHLKSIKRLVR